MPVRDWNSSTFDLNSAFWALFVYTPLSSVPAYLRQSNVGAAAAAAAGVGGAAAGAGAQAAMARPTPVVAPSSRKRRRVSESRVQACISGRSMLTPHPLDGVRVLALFVYTSVAARQLCVRRSSTVQTSEMDSVNGSPTT